MAENHSVLMVFYDLPVTTSNDRKHYRQFRKKLIASGFMSFQESVYIKLLRRHAALPEEIKKVKAIAPRDGELSVLPLSLSSFKELTTIRGVGFDMGGFSDDVVFL